MDVVLSVVMLILALPVMVVVAVAVCASMGWPVLFRQMRPGYGGRTFVPYKFRTMKHACDNDGIPLPDSQRLTKVGRFLRATSLDELPQLFNVIKGEMSLVGPRPLLMEYLPYYTRRESLRHTVRPGITGWSQVNGRNAVPWDDRLEDDVWYVENWSLGLDIKILLLTVSTVTRRDGLIVDAQSAIRLLSEERRRHGAIRRVNSDGCTHQPRNH
jgi:lipopolysaccharide/colanic/teichoic acid biosynthesis glycosyltransferase